MPPKKEEITYFSLKREIEQKQFRPIYVLQGEEPYYIDKLCGLIVDNALTEDEKAFNLTLCYGVDVEMRNVIAACKQYPAMSQYQVVVLREAQNVGKAGNKHASEINMLQFYAQKPLDSTILVICYKGGSIKANDFTKELKKTKGIVYTSNKVRDYEVPKLVREYCRSINVNIDEKSVSMLAEHIGSDLSRLFGEIDKLKLLTDAKNMITPDLIERNIGYSKEFNIFELEAKDRSEAGLMEQVNIRSPFRVKKLVEAASSFSKRSCVNIISYIRKCDVKSKGQGSRQDPYDLFKELIYKILHS